VALYKYGGMVELDLLFAASSTHEAMTTAYLLNRMTEEDKRLFEEAAARKKLLDTSREEVLRQKEILTAQRAAAEQARKRLAAAVKKRNGFLQEVRTSRGSLEAAAKELAREQQEIEQVIRKLLVERQRLAEKKRREEAERTGRTDTLLVRPSGPLSWPHRGQITSPFGIRQHPIFRTRIMHTGIDIDGRDGDPVQAAAAGEVLYAGWLKGYGQVIILDHGGELSTVYAHLSRMHVEEGARVTKGQVIGRVGSTGVATGRREGSHALSGAVTRRSQEARRLPGGAPRKSDAAEKRGDRGRRHAGGVDAESARRSGCVMKNFAKVRVANMWKRMRDLLGGFVLGGVLVGALMGASAQNMDLTQMVPFRAQSLWLMKQARAILETYQVDGETPVSEDVLVQGAIKASLNINFLEALRMSEIMYLDGCMKTKDAIEGISAFMDKRKAVWKDE
jgi:murein DD-endopeptidase MepM/ murein hydrolase activator NlpD